jgi:hypothetical protein
MDLCASSHMTLDRNCFQAFSSVGDNGVIADMIQAEYMGVGSIRLFCRLPSGDISVVLSHHVLFVPNLRQSL